MNQISSDEVLTSMMDISCTCTAKKIITLNKYPDDFGFSVCLSVAYFIEYGTHKAPTHQAKVDKW